MNKCCLWGFPLPYIVRIFCICWLARVGFFVSWEDRWLSVCEDLFCVLRAFSVLVGWQLNTRFLISICFVFVRWSSIIEGVDRTENESVSVRLLGFITQEGSKNLDGWFLILNFCFCFEWMNIWKSSELGASMACFLFWRNIWKSMDLLHQNVAAVNVHIWKSMNLLHQRLSFCFEGTYGSLWTAPSMAGFFGVYVVNSSGVYLLFLYFY